MWDRDKNYLSKLRGFEEIPIPKEAIALYLHYDGEPIPNTLDDLDSVDLIGFAVDEKKILEEGMKYRNPYDNNSFIKVIKSSIIIDRALVSIESNVK